MKIKQLSEKIGVDDDVIDVNFGGKDNLYLKCVSLFSKYDFIFEIENAISESNYNIIESKAHALKGISANLGFRELYELSSRIVINARSNNFDEIPSVFRYLKMEYNRIIDILKTSELW